MKKLLITSQLVWPALLVPVFFIGPPHVGPINFFTAYCVLWLAFAVALLTFARRWAWWAWLIMAALFTAQFSTIMLTATERSVSINAAMFALPTLLQVVLVAASGRGTLPERDGNAA